MEGELLLGAQLLLRMGEDKLLLLFKLLFILLFIVELGVLTAAGAGVTGFTPLLLPTDDEGLLDSWDSNERADSDLGLL